MSAQSYDTFVLAFSDPTSNSPDPQRARINANSSFELFDDSHIRTLSSNSGGGDIEGLLYVPTLQEFDPCVNASAQYVPNNVTRLSNLPQVEYVYIAFAPWISAACTKSYLAAAQGITAFMFYVPDNGTTTPPPVNDETWDLHDGGRWKARYKFPVYAIPGAEGAATMQQLAQYSGNSSNDEISAILSEVQFDQSDYVRLYTSFATTGSNNLPTLWAFLLIVLGIVLLLIGATSVSMRYFQRRHRRALQRRVENGEVDLETLGIKRSHRIPPEEIDKLPTYIYVPTNDIPNEVNRAQFSEASSETAAENHTFFSQSSCTICLEDFIPKATEVRSLPCHHIYHPQCIDPHLASRSSRCPVCMAQVLPTKNEPITNAMVRAERRLRERQRMHGGSADGINGTWWITNFRRQVERGRRIFSAPDTMGGTTQPTRSQIEMNAVGGRTVSSPMPAASNRTAAEMSGLQTEAGEVRPPAADVDARRERMRMRLSRMRGPERTLEDEETERWARMPRWRRAVGTMFPGFG